MPAPARRLVLSAALALALAPAAHAAPGTAVHTARAAPRPAAKPAAAPAPKPADRPSVGPPPAWVLAAAIPAPPPGTEGVAATVLLADQQTRLTNAGDARYVDTAIRIGSSQGLQAAALALAWDPALETLVIHRYRILRDGKPIDLLGDGSKLTVVRRETNLERAALDGQLTATLQPEDVRVGDVIETAYTQTRRDPALAGRSQALFGMTPGQTVGRVRLRALWPADKAVHWRASVGAFVPKERALGTEREMVAEILNATTARPPKGAPLRFEIVNLVQASDMGGWPDISRSMAPLYTKATALGANSAVKAEAARIAAASPDPKARALAALKLVQEQVRYVLLTMDDGGYVPAPADTTWARRFGDCKGKTVLLLALLKDLGIEARAALVSTQAGDGIDARLPMLGAFDHVLVQATIAGRTYWLDGTRPGDRALDQIRTPEFHWALPVSVAGSELLRLIPDPLERPQEITTLDLDASKGLDVPAHATGEQRLEGDMALGFRIGLAQLPPEQRDRALRDYWHKAYQFVTPETVSAIDDPATGAFRLTMSGTARMEWTAYNGRRWYELDGARVGFKMDTAREPGPNQDAPFAVQFPAWSESRQTVLLPAMGKGFTLDAGDVDRTIAAYTFHRAVKIDGAKLTMVASTRVLGPEIPFKGVEAARTALAALGERGVSVGAPANFRMTDGDMAALKAEAPDTAEGYLERAERLSTRGEWKAVLADADAAIALRADYALAHGVRAVALANLGDARYAAAADRTLALDPKSPFAWNARAWAAMREKHYNDVIADLTYSLAAAPNEPWALQLRGFAYSMTRRYEEAKADYAALNKIAPSPYGLIASGDAHWRAGQREEAIVDLNAALATDPTLIEARRIRGQVLFDLRRWPEANADLSAAIADKPEAGLLVDRAQTWPAADKAKRAADIDRAVALAPGDNSALKLRALDRGRAGNFAGAEADLAAATRLDPADTQLAVIRVDMLRRRAPAQANAGDYARAAATIGEALKTMPDNIDLILQRADILTYAGQVEEARALFDRAVAAQPGNALVWNDRCWFRATMDVDAEHAVADCNTALKLSPNNPGYLDSRGFAWLRLGKWDAALADYDAALKQGPDHNYSRYGRAVARLHLGHTEAATEIAEVRLAAPAIAADFRRWRMTVPGDDAPVRNSSSGTLAGSSGASAVPTAASTVPSDGSTVRSAVAAPGAPTVIRVTGPPPPARLRAAPPGAM